MAEPTARAKPARTLTCRTKTHAILASPQVAIEGGFCEGGLGGGGWAEGGLEDVGVPAPIGVPLNAATGTSPQRLRREADPDSVWFKPNDDVVTV